MPKALKRAPLAHEPIGTADSASACRRNSSGDAGTAMRVAIAVLGLIATLAGISPAAAQVVPKSLRQPRTEASAQIEKNTWTVGIAGGLASGTYMRFAVELAQALDDGNNLRVLPIVSFGAASNLDDLLYMHGVDIAITQTDVFEYFRTTRKISHLDKRIDYIIRLPLSEVHILARNDIRTIEDLGGKKVSLGPEGSASSLTGAIIFQRLGVDIEQTNLNYPTALAKLKSGELSALVRVVGKPVDALARIPENSGFHLLTIPFSDKFADYYTLGELSHQDYPALIPEGQQIDTIAVPAVLAVRDWSIKSDRYRRVKRFVERLFANWDKFQQPPFHKKWQDVNLAATVPGWNRFGVAKNLLKQMAKAETASPGKLEKLKQNFLTFLEQNGKAGQPQSDAEREALFKEFISWRQKRGHADRTNRLARADATSIKDVGEHK
jgi:uncharacterized protein